MNSSDNVLRRLAAVAAVMCMFLVFGASGAQAVVPLPTVASSGSLTAEEHDTGDEESDEPSDEEDSTDDPEDNSDEEDSDDEDSDDEDSESDEPTDEPSDESTFPATPSADATDDIAEMPTQDAGATTEESASPLGWVLLGAGVLTALAAVVVYRRNRHLM